MQPKHIVTFSKIKYAPINTDWFYSYVHIPNLSVIQEELITLLKTAQYIRYTNYYINVLNSNVIECPELMQYLDKLQLKHKFQRLLFSITKGLDANSILPHVDSVTPLVGIKYSLNIPLVDALDSYVVWYEKTNNEELLYDINTYTGWVKDKTNVKEIERVQYTQPVLLNTTILHSPEVNSSNRLICGLRFWPELTDEEILRIQIL